jgi:hypothetical protein
MPMGRHLAEQRKGDVGIDGRGVTRGVKAQGGNTRGQELQGGWVRGEGGVGLEVND